MDRSTRAAHRRVGAVAIAAFLALLLLGLNRGPASANQAAPAASPTAEPSQQQQQQAPDFGGDHERRGPRFRDGGGDPDFGGGGGPGFDGGGGAPAPAPSTPSTPDTGTSTT